MIYRKPFCFGNLMVRRKKMQKGCREREKKYKKVKQETVLSGIVSCSY